MTTTPRGHRLARANRANGWTRAAHKTASGVAVLISAALLLTGCSGATPAPAVSNLPTTVSTGLTFTTVGGTALKLDACVPTTGTALPVVVLIHGGSFQFGSTSELRTTCKEGAARGMAMFAVDYRVAPAAHYPGQLDDVAAAVRWIEAPAQKTRFRTDPTRMSVLGSSAGAVVAADLAVGVPKSPIPKSTFRSAVLLSGVYDFDSTDITSDTLLGVKYAYLGCDAGAVPCALSHDASAIYHVGKSDPPMFLVNSTKELVPETQATAFAAALKKAGVTYTLTIVPGNNHAIGIVDADPDAEAKMWAFLQSTLAK